MHLGDWAARWGVGPAALADLVGVDTSQPAQDVPGGSEAAVQARVRVAASRAGLRLWRNNVGAFQDPGSGAMIRFGLANDSAQVNKTLKSADLIGIRPVLIAPAHVGRVIGQFVSLECKHAAWRWGNTERERAQAAWAALVIRLGGEASFITSEGGLR